MKEKNKKMIVIVTSLLLVVGVSLAYFTATVLLGGDGTSVTGSTTTIQDSTVIVEGTLEFNDLDIYPGHESASSIRVTATGNNELIPYNVIWKGTNTLNTPLNYTVYKTSSSIDVSTSCEKKSEVMGGAKIYYEECTISNIESLGSPITEGTITTSEEETTIELIGDEFITSTQSGTSWYYYVILEYPNLEENQNIDMGGTFNGEITIEESDAEPDINIIAAYIEQEDGTYEQVSDIPQEGYGINMEKSTCSNGAIPSGRVPNITINNLSKSGTSCYLYFDEQLCPEGAEACNTILTNRDVQERIFPITTSTKVEGTNGYGDIYSASEGNGTTYYFAGNPTDNWVYFAGFYWRIIRINSDGSVRLIYSGDSSSGPVVVGEDTQLPNDSSYNNLYNASYYVGLNYSNIQHGTGTDSTVLTALNTWYRQNLLSQADKLTSGTGFCGDREVASGYTWSADEAVYAARMRLINLKNDIVPTFDCSNSDDLYTTGVSGIGNRALTYPIGLITADEVVYAGLPSNGSTVDNYLYTGEHYWTMTPSAFISSANVLTVHPFGYLYEFSIASPRAIRPVINLRSDIQLSGSGTTSDPYTVVES